MSEEIKEVEEVLKETKVPETNIDFSFLDKVADNVVSKKPVDTSITAKETKTSNESEEEYLEVDHLKEKKKIPKSEWKTNIQKGLQYDHTRSELDAEKLRIVELQQELDKERVKSANAEILAKRREIAKEFEDEGYDVDKLNKYIDSHPAILKANAYVAEIEAKNNLIDMKLRVSKDKDALRDKPLFNDVEARIDQMIKDFPKLAVDTAYTLAIGELMRSGEYEKIKENAKNIATKEAHNNLKRGTKNLSSDSSDNKETKPQSAFAKAFAKSYEHLLKGG